MSGMQWRVEMLGGLRVVRDAEVVTRFSTVKTAALFAYLAYYPRRQHAREVLTDLFWPDNDSQAGRMSLRVALASLRRQFEPPGVETGSVLITDRLYVSLNPRAFEPSDVAEFEEALRKARGSVALSEALALYRGELLPGFYDDWIQNERERLARLFEGAEAQAGGATHGSIAATASSPPVALPVTPPAATITPRLPIPFTVFRGRKDEKARLAALLVPASSVPGALVTLTGPGGVGKTRLSIEAAHEAAGGFSGAVFFVGLADLSDARQIAGRIVAQAFSLVPTPAGGDPLDQITRALAAHPTALLILDNMEQLAETGAAVVQALRNRVPHLVCLVTSRRRLALPGEQEMPLEPLPIPPPEGIDPPDSAHLARIPSVQLFTDRAQAARPDFQVTPRNAGDVAALCRALDGIPLALELVAARASSLSPARMRAGLTETQSRWELISTRRTDKAARHRSLHAAISWSMELLPPALQSFWTRLSVFRGGCTSEAAREVCGEPSALEYLTQLRERSLLVLDEQYDGELRFRMLETLREFASERLEYEERQALGVAHADYFLRISEESRNEILGPKQGAWLAYFDREVDNVRAALTFYAADTGSMASGEKGLLLATALRLFWPKRGLTAEGRHVLAVALSHQGAQAPTEARASALTLAGRMARQQADFHAALLFCSQGLEIRRILGSPEMIANTLHDMGKIYSEQGDYATARVFYAEGLAQGRLSGDKGTIALLLASLAGSDMEQGNYAPAQVAYEEALALQRQMKDPGNTAAILANLGCIAVELGDEEKALRLWEETLEINRASHRRPDIAIMLAISVPLRCRRGELREAEAALYESLALCQELGEPRISLIALESAAELAGAKNHAESALRHLAAATTLRASQGIPLPPSEVPKIAALQSRMETLLSLPALVHARQQGAVQTLGRALADAMQTASALSSL